MDIVRAFTNNDMHTPIVINGTNEKPLFRASDIGLILELTNIRVSTNEFDDSEKVTCTTNTSTGEKNVTFLTEKGLYKLLFRSRKPIAEKFQNWLCAVLNEIRLKGSYELKIQLEQKGNEILDIEYRNKLEYTKLLKEKELDKQNILLTEYNKNISLVYIIKVKSFINGEYIVKIGESRRGIVDRFNEHKTSYEEVLLLNCFAVNRSKDFENFLHNHELIRDNRVTDLKGHLTERELFLIGKNLTYSTLMNVVKSNINHFENNDNELEKARIEYESLKLITEMNNSDFKTIIQQLVSNNKLLLDKIDRLEDLILKKIDNNTAPPKITTGFNNPLLTLGPRLQQINPETFQLIRVYETVTECLNENKKVKRSSLKKAVVDNTIYNGFRWLLVSRDQDASVIVAIEKTKTTRIQHLGYIAKMNKEKNEILNVYLDRKNACISNGYKAESSLNTSIQKFTLSNGHYYLLYDSCEDELKEKFIKKYGEPLLYKNGVGQFDTNKKMTREFTCKDNCISIIGTSSKTLTKILDKDGIFHNFSYRHIGSKLKVHDD
jgi:prophage antirepressor-like protein